MNKLQKYQEKRNFNKTKEPKGIIRKSSKKLKFCVQHHLARKDHYDFRLEYNGVLISFAVPKGPSYNIEDKRLAIHVEDHPLSYWNFEGTIPKGEYGGGTVMLFDYGYWQPIKETKVDFKKGPIKFILKGHRLVGTWMLAKLKDNNWLLIKEKDNLKTFNDINEFNTSIKTGRTMEEIANNSKIIKKSKDEIIIEGITITNPYKIIFKNPKVTKLDIVLYYQAIAKRMLPYLENRPISVIRAPEGIFGTKFFKKHLESNSGLGKVTIKDFDQDKNDYYYIKNIKGLINEIQMNSYEFHIWGSKVPRLKHPDMLVFDLDPDEKVSLKKVRDGVRDLKSILDELRLDSYLKTSGGKGYHIVVPISNVSLKEYKEIAMNIAKLMEAKWPNKYTTNMRLKSRKGKIFIDYLRNSFGATSVAPYSVRLRKKATVSLPIAWSDLDKVRPDTFTIKDLNKIIKEPNPWPNF